MEPLPPIPVPPGHRWREFRVKALPVIVFLGVLLAVSLTWRQYLGSSGVLAEVESVNVNILSTVSGRLAELSVTRFQEVTQNQAIAVIRPVEPEQLAASLLAARMDLKVLRARMELDQTRNVQSFSRLRLELALERLDLEVARIQLAQAETEFQRGRTLYEAGIVPRGLGDDRNEFGYDVALRDRDRWRAEVAARERAVAEFAAHLAQQPTGLTEPLDPLIEQAIATHENRLLLLEGPIQLRSPVSGAVSLVHRRPGELLQAGDLIVTIGAQPLTHIVGFVRQPLNVLPKPGDRVQVRTRGPQRQQGEAEVVQVGNDLQVISPTLQPRAFASLEERGLPFLVSIPPGMELFPGELVEVIFLR